MRYLMWDIDGTLLLTGLAGKDALLKVVKDFYFLDAYECNIPFPGRTDSGIFKEIVTGLRGRCHVGEVASLMIRYHAQLAKELPTHHGRLMKNVLPTLEYFDRADSKYKNCLLSGNTRTGAWLKLQYYKLEHFFDFNHSVFGEISENRDELARTLFSRFYLETNGTITPDDFIFIGDTPLDVQCAQAIGARCLVILDGSQYKAEDFADTQPWKIIPALPDDPAVLERLFDEA